MQLASKGIKVNAIAPGVVVTALQAASRHPDDMQELGVGQPLRNRGAQPAELGPSYVFLAGSDSNAVTGAVLHVNCKFLFRLSVAVSEPYMCLPCFAVGKHVGGS